MSTKLVDLRARAGLTQIEVARAMGSAQGEVSLLERRESLDPVRIDTLRRYAEALGGELEVAIVIGRGRHVVG